MTKTVSVELTENQLRATLEAYRHWERRWASTIIPDDDANAAIAVFKEARRQFNTDREREAKVEALLNNLTFKAAWNSDASDTMKRLNRAGWDLVRMEEAE
jgi:hypothetical protein